MRNCSGRQTVSIPLIGSGAAGVGLPNNILIHIIICSILKSTQKQEITKEIRIVLHESLFEEIELRQIKKQWT